MCVLTMPLETLSPCNIHVMCKMEPAHDNLYFSHMPASKALMSQRTSALTPTKYELSLLKHIMKGRTCAEFKTKIYAYMPLAQLRMQGIHWIRLNHLPAATPPPPHIPVFEYPMNMK